jgi:ribosomal protein L40E
MSRRKVGYVELEWNCPNCGGRNPGSLKTCRACGGPQPKDVQFEQAQGASLIEDEDKIARAKKGPDIHCPYCGTRNLGDAETCVQCGGDLSEGARRAAGRVVGAFDTQAGPLPPVTCPSCGAENPGTNKTCSACGSHISRQPEKPSQDVDKPDNPKKKASKWLFVILGLFVFLCCGLVALFAFRTGETTGVVRDVAWERSIAIQVMGEVNREAWRDQLPAGVQPLACTEQLRTTQDQPAPRSREVCGTPYSVDTGSGFAEVVQDCVYEVYDDYCEYVAKDWMIGETLTAQGRDYNPYWPQVQLASDQREGERTERYRVYFETDDGIREFSTSNESLFMQLQPGTTWTLEYNVFGAIVSVRR